LLLVCLGRWPLRRLDAHSQGRLWAGTSGGRNVRKQVCLLQGDGGVARRCARCRLLLPLLLGLIRWLRCGAAA
jgi:hypothetical protein